MKETPQSSLTSNQKKELALRLKSVYVHGEENVEKIKELRTSIISNGVDSPEYREAFGSLILAVVRELDPVFDHMIGLARKNAAASAKKPAKLKEDQVKTIRADLEKLLNQTEGGSGDNEKSVDKWKKEKAELRALLAEKDLDAASFLSKLYKIREGLVKRGNDIVK
jgi:hypothetical protein